MEDIVRENTLLAEQAASSTKIMLLFGFRFKGGLLLHNYVAVTELSM